MKLNQVFIIIICILSFEKLVAQPIEGKVWYRTVNIDTISDEIVPQDSLYVKYSFKPNKTKWEMGFLNHLMSLETIQNEKDFYVISHEPGSHTALHGLLPDVNGVDELLQYKDQKLIVIKSESTKTIAGFLCKKITLRFFEDDPGTVLWYNETFHCNSFIPNAGASGLCIKGIVLEYEITTATGKNIITAEEVDFGEVSDDEFNPDLTDLEVMEMQK